MTKYLIKSTKIEEGMYKHEMYDGNFNQLNPETKLENNQTVSNFLENYSMSHVPFLRKNNLSESKLEVSIVKD